MSAEAITKDDLHKIVSRFSEVVYAESMGQVDQRLIEWMHKAIDTAQLEPIKNKRLFEGTE